MASAKPPTKKRFNDPGRGTWQPHDARSSTGRGRKVATIGSPISPSKRTRRLLRRYCLHFNLRYPTAEIAWQSLVKKQKSLCRQIIRAQLGLGHRVITDPTPFWNISNPKPYFRTKAVQYKINPEWHSAMPNSVSAALYQMDGIQAIVPIIYRRQLP